MNNIIPNFIWRPAGHSNNYVAYIEVEGVTIHKIKSQEEYYNEFGYTPDIRKSGLLPDEFIWNEYTRNTSVNYSFCKQIHIIRYLAKYSVTFIEKYGNQYEAWLAAYAEENAVRGIACVVCRMKSSCAGMKIETDDYLGGQTSSKAKASAKIGLNTQKDVSDRRT